MTEQITCKELVELITDYLEGNLPEDLRAQVDRHIAGCDGCTNYLDQMQTTIQLTGRIQEENLSSKQRSDLLQLFRDWKNN